MSERTDLSQPGCLIEGMTQLLSFAAGDFAVVLHSEPDCANLVFRDSRVVDPRRFLCTNLTEREAVAGRGGEKLWRAVSEARRRCGKQGTVFVLGGCVASMMGEDLDAAARRHAGCGKLVVLSGAAFGKVGQAELIDRFCELLVRENLPNRKPKSRARRVALLGYPDDGGECQRLLASAGVELCRLDPTSDFARWECLRAGPLLVVPDRELFARTGTAWAERGLALMEAPLPLGLSRSLEFYRALGSSLALTPRAKETPSRDRPRWLAWPRGRSRQTKIANRLREEAHRAVRRFWRGNARRLAYHVGSRKDFEAFTSAYGGLVALPLFLELGFEITLFFQGAVESERQEQIRRLLQRYGISRPFACLPDRLSLAVALKKGRFDAVFCDESLRDEAGAAHTPMITRAALHLGLGGVAPSCREIERAISNSAVAFTRKKA
ncbi:MAG: hypothetical protein GYA21_10860 [Myxococcales bacterium]|nr:hypothetical protein [Myxococcales bacterium]